MFNDVLEGMGEDAKVLARYGGSAYYAGEPALVETKAGEGKVLHFGGTFTRELVDALLEYTGIREPFGELAQIPAACEIALRRKEGEEYLFVLNYSKEPQELVLKQPMVDLDNPLRFPRAGGFGKLRNQGLPGAEVNENKSVGCAAPWRPRKRTPRERVSPGGSCLDDRALGGRDAQQKRAPEGALCERLFTVPF